MKFKVKWTQVTWYSRLAAIVFFMGIFPTLSFYIGLQYAFFLTENVVLSSTSALVPQTEVLK
jgi:hypothetical protein